MLFMNIQKFLLLYYSSDKGGVPVRSTYPIKARGSITALNINLRLALHSYMSGCYAMMKWVSRDKEERSRTRIIDAGSPRGRGRVEEGSKLGSRGVVVRQWSQRSETYFWVTDTAESDFTRCYTSPPIPRAS